MALGACDRGDQDDLPIMVLQHLRHGVLGECEGTPDE